MGVRGLQRAIARHQQRNVQRPSAPRALSASPATRSSAMCGARPSAIGLAALLAGTGALSGCTISHCEQPASSDPPAKTFFRGPVQYLGIVLAVVGIVRLIGGIVRRPHSGLLGALAFLGVSSIPLYLTTRSLHSPAVEKDANCTFFGKPVWGRLSAPAFIDGFALPENTAFALSNNDDETLVRISDRSGIASVDIAFPQGRFAVRDADRRMGAWFVTGKLLDNAIVNGLPLTAGAEFNEAPLDGASWHGIRGTLFASYNRDHMDFPAGTELHDGYLVSTTPFTAVGYHWQSAQYDFREYPTIQGVLANDSQFPDPDDPQTTLILPKGTTVAYRIDGKQLLSVQTTVTTKIGNHLVPAQTEVSWEQGPDQKESITLGDDGQLNNVPLKKGATASRDGRNITGVLSARAQLRMRGHLLDCPAGSSIRIVAGELTQLTLSESREIGDVVFAAGTIIQSPPNNASLQIVGTLEKSGHVPTGTTVEGILNANVVLPAGVKVTVPLSDQVAAPLTREK